MNTPRALLLASALLGLSACIPQETSRSEETNQVTKLPPEYIITLEKNELWKLDVKDPNFSQSPVFVAVTGQGLLKLDRLVSGGDAGGGREAELVHQPKKGDQPALFTVTVYLDSGANPEQRQRIVCQANPTADPLVWQGKSAVGNAAGVQRAISSNAFTGTCTLSKVLKV